MDAGYGDDTELRTVITALSMSYLAGILTTITVWPPGTARLMPQTRSGRGWHRPGFSATASTSRPASRRRPLACPKRRGKRSLGQRAVRIGCPHVLPASGCGPLIVTQAAPAAPRKVAADRAAGKRNRTDQVLVTTLPEDITFDRLVDLAKLRWRIEHDYQELKQELGLGNYEGRGWRGFHHHASLCIAAHGFLIAERGALPPQDQLSFTPLSHLQFPRGYRPRGAAAPTRTA